MLIVNYVDDLYCCIGVLILEIEFIQIPASSGFFVAFRYMYIVHDIVDCMFTSSPV